MANETFLVRLLTLQKSLAMGGVYPYSVVRKAVKDPAFQQKLSSGELTGDAKTVSGGVYSCVLRSVSLRRDCLWGEIEIIGCPKNSFVEKVLPNGYLSFDHGNIVSAEIAGVDVKLVVPKGE